MILENTVTKTKAERSNKYMRSLWIVTLTLLLFTLTSSTTYSNIVNSTDNNRTSATPDFYQRDTRFGTLPLNGSMYCGPVAVSNSLVWLSRNGFPSLLPSTGNSMSDQYSLIEKLGSEKYMDTDFTGSGVEDLCRGIKKYLGEKGIRGKLFFEGMYTVTNQFRGSRVPDIEEIRKHTHGKRAAWLNIGWYRFDPERGEYHKTGGHWVTLTGIISKNNSFTLVIHDPDSKGKKTEYIDLEEIEKGKFFNSRNGKPKDAAGFRRFKTGPHTFGVIGGVVYLSLEKTETDPVAFKF